VPTANTRDARKRRGQRRWAQVPTCEFTLVLRTLKTHRTGWRFFSPGPDTPDICRSLRRSNRRVLVPIDKSCSLSMS